MSSVHWILSLTEILMIYLNTAKTEGSYPFVVWNVSLPYEMNFIGFGVRNNTLRVYNGDTQYSPLLYVYSLLLSPLSSRWKNKYLYPNMPFNSIQLDYCGQSVVQINNFVFGVHPFTVPDANELYQTMLIFDLDTNAYVNISTYSYISPYQSQYPCIVANDSFIFSIGGRWSNASNITFIFNINEDEWYQGGNLNIARSASGCSFDSTRNSIYIFGGIDDSNVNTNSIEIYYKNNWNLINITMPYAVSYHFCILYEVDSNIYCIGGKNDTDAVDYIQIFDSETQTFKISKLNIARYDFAVTVWNNCMFVMGGRSHYNKVISSIELMNCEFLYD